MTIGDNQQFICNSQPFCLCVGHVKMNEWNECDCFAVDASGATWRQSDVLTFAQGPVTCSMCGAEMVLIDIESGEEVKAA